MPRFNVDESTDKGWMPPTEVPDEADQTAAPCWPAPLAVEAFYGILGDWVKLVEPETESDPAALLIQALVELGNLMGHGPHFRAEDDQHHPSLYAVLVGQTSKARKGTSEGRVRRLLASVDPDWARGRVKRA